MVGKKIDFAIKNSDGIIPTVYRNGKIATAPYTTSSLLSYPFLSVIEKIQLIRFVRKATREQPDRLDNTSISAWLIELGLDKNQNLMDHLKMFISIAFYCEPNFDIMSAGELVRFFQKYPYDTGYPIGGWRQIIDKLVAVIEDNQGKIITNAKVEGIVLQGDEGSRSLSSSS